MSEMDEDYQSRLSALTSWLDHEKRFHQRPDVQDAIALAHTIIGEWRHLRENRPGIYAKIFPASAFAPKEATKQGDHNA